MDYRHIKTVEELIVLDLQNCYARRGVLGQSLNIILVGKPVIAEFLGISEKTLKRYFKEDHRLHDIPISRNQHRCLALTNDLFRWSIQCELNKVDSRLVEKARYIDMSERMGVSLEHFMEQYIYESQHRDYTNAKRLRTRTFYKKTIDRIVKLVRGQSLVG